jgi:hypothetical protein
MRWLADSTPRRDKLDATYVTLREPSGPFEIRPTAGVPWS